jgi:anti-anti-sigma factor
MLFGIDASNREGVVRLRLRGEFDLAAVAALSAAIDDGLAAAPTRGLVLDVHEVTFLDCATLGVLMRGHLVAAKQGLPYEAVGARGLPRSVMEMTGILAVLEPPPQEAT